LGGGGGGWGGGGGVGGWGGGVVGGGGRGGGGELLSLCTKWKSLGARRVREKVFPKNDGQV